MTGKQMCETIVRADILRKPDGTPPTAEEIWSYSPTGELDMVFAWHKLARLALGEMTSEQFWQEKHDELKQLGLDEDQIKHFLTPIPVE